MKDPLYMTPDNSSVSIPGLKIEGTLMKSKHFT